ncbi:hypothetical protein KI659_09320 [Litoribacter alkaliphilus]|uniref:Uncharacterized protein n=1 Tax=Litoribacter ruber TaxID=702568 RepID=A0AAP2G1I3_9BACT|nr:hypothetical protein [Litoribacter alkaliphilus]MBS9524212.1 hypothetical protein [Litoribacter alkaliphilus]
MKIFSSMYTKLIGLTLGIAALVAIISMLGFEQLLHAKVWNIILFFFFLTLVMVFLTQLILKNGEENFAQVVLGATIFRFFFSLGYILIFLFLGLDNIILFVTNFFAVYLLYLLFDIYGLITNLRPHSK